MKAPSPPTPPDPNVVSNAQTTSNVDTAKANTIMGNANERNPYGSVDYKITGWKKVGGRNVPQYTRTTKLTADQQKLLDQQEGLGMQMNDIAGRQMTRVDNTLSQPIDLQNLPQAPTSIQTQQLDKLENKDWSEDRQRVEDAMYSRLNPEMDRRRAAMETQLANQGVRAGSEAYREAMALQDRSENDARMQVLLAGGDEQSRLAGLDQARTGFNNQVGLSKFDMDRSAGEYAQTSRERAFQEQMAARNQTINEISALMSGGQVTAPQFSPYKGGNIANTDVAGNYWKNYDAQMQGYQAKLANKQAMMGGIAGIAGSIPSMFFGGF